MSVDASKVKTDGTIETNETEGNNKTNEITFEMVQKYTDEQIKSIATHGLKSAKALEETSTFCSAAGDGPSSGVCANAVDVDYVDSPDNDLTPVENIVEGLVYNDMVGVIPVVLERFYTTQVADKAEAVTVLNERATRSILFCIEPDVLDKHSNCGWSTLRFPWIDVPLNEVPANRIKSIFLPDVLALDLAALKTAFKTPAIFPVSQKDISFTIGSAYISDKLVIAQNSSTNNSTGNGKGNSKNNTRSSLWDNSDDDSMDNSNSNSTNNLRGQTLTLTVPDYETAVKHLIQTARDSKTPAAKKMLFHVARLPTPMDIHTKRLKEENENVETRWSRSFFSSVDDKTKIPYVGSIERLLTDYPLAKDFARVQQALEEALQNAMMCVENNTAVNATVNATNNATAVTTTSTTIATVASVTANSANSASNLPAIVNKGTLNLILSYLFKAGIVTEPGSSSSNSSNCSNSSNSSKKAILVKPSTF